MRTDNAEVDYVNEAGVILATVPFYDPGLDPMSSYWAEERRQGGKVRPRMAYGCGRPLR